MSEQIPVIDDFPFSCVIPTRWSDNDMFGHLNNVLYYRFYEAAILKFLGERTAYDAMNPTVLVFAAETQCRFLKPLGYPGDIVAAVGIQHLGRSSVRYGLALFAPGEKQASATGYWVHVFVDKENQRPLPIPDDVRAAFSQQMMKSNG